jgi:hypothetical protein
MLTALAMMALILASLYTTFHTTLQARERAYKRLETAMPRDQVSDLLRRDLAGATPPVGILAGPLVGEKTEQGDARLDRIEFYTATGLLDDTTPWGDIQWIAYYVAAPENADQPGLDFVRAVDHNLLSVVEEDPEEQVLLQGVASLIFEYYDGYEWFDDWDSTTQGDQCPLAVRARIEFEPPSDDDEPAPSPLEVVVEIVARAVVAESSGSGGAAGGASTGSSGAASTGAGGGRP